jgi:hypothetical protein
MQMNRRRFFQTAAAGIATGLFDSACTSTRDANSDGLDRPALLTMLGAERVRELGNHYRSTHPNENDAAALRDSISKGQAHLRIPFFTHTSLSDQIKNEFAQGRTVLVDGWVLSATEARQAALFSLTHA